MSVENNPLKFWEQSDKIAKDLEQAKERFKQKSFYEEWVIIRNTARYVQKLLPSLSVVTGTFFLTKIFNAFIPFIWVCAFLGIFILINWEFGKKLLLIKVFEFYYKSQKLPLALILITSSFISGSIYFSIEGTRQLSKVLDNTESNINAIYSLKADSISLYYDSLITESNQKAKQYFSANNFKGVITYTKDGAVSKQYQKLADRVLDLEKEKEFQRAQIIHQKRNVLDNKTDEFLKFILAILTIVFFIEVLIILANWFIVYFDYRIKEQEELINKNLNLYHDWNKNQFQGISQNTSYTNHNPEIKVHPNEEISDNHKADINERFPISFTLNKDQINGKYYEKPDENDNRTETVLSQELKNNTFTLEKKKQKFNGYKITCLYCSKTVIKKSPRAKYCCDEHRILDFKKRKK